VIILHHLNNSRSQRILWLMEELNLEYQIKSYQRDPITIRAPRELKSIHPLGKSPVVTDGDVTVAESGAIVDYLIRQYGRQCLAPSETSAAYLDYVYWMHFAEGSFMPPLLMRILFMKVKSNPMPFFIKPVARMISDKVMERFISPEIRNTLDYIEVYLTGREWLAGVALSGADIQMSFPLEASVARGLVSDQYPNILAYVKRFQVLPGYLRALDRGGDYDYGPLTKASSLS